MCETRSMTSIILFNHSRDEGSLYMYPIIIICHTIHVISVYSVPLYILSYWDGVPTLIPHPLISPFMINTTKKCLIVCIPCQKLMENMMVKNLSLSNDLETLNRRKKFFNSQIVSWKNSILFPFFGISCPYIWRIFKKSNNSFSGPMNNSRKGTFI